MCAIILSLSFFSSPTLAQEEDFDFVDALAPVDASASAFHNQKFGEAERALTEGLSRKVADRPPPMQQPKMHNVSATQQQTVTRQIPKLAESPSRSEAAVRNDSGEIRSRPKPASQSAGGGSTQLLQAINAQTGQDVQGPKPSNDKRPASEAVARSVGSKEPMAGPKANVVAHRPPEQKKQVVKTEVPKTVDDTAQLRRELADAKSQLAAAEVEIARLSSIVQDASRARLSLPPTGSKLFRATSKEYSAASAAPERTTQAPVVRHPQVAAPNLNDDLQVATISVDKADLRLGPGRNHSALMSLRRGSRLAVEARQGEWYRVFAPNGQRAWIHASLVRFGDGASSLNDGSSVTVRGYDAKLR